MPKYMVVEEAIECVVRRTMIVEAPDEESASEDPHGQKILSTVTGGEEGEARTIECNEVLGPGVYAECHSDDWKFQAVFDASLWFSQALDKEILDLAKCGWRGDQPADAVAQFMSDYDRDVADLFKYVEAVDGMGFECVVDAVEAIRWLEKNKPELHKKILEIEEGKQS